MDVRLVLKLKSGSLIWVDEVILHINETAFSNGFGLQLCGLLEIPLKKSHNLTVLEVISANLLPCHWRQSHVSTPQLLHPLTEDP